MANAERIEFESATLFKELVDKGQLKSLVSVKNSPYPKYCFKNNDKVADIVGKFVAQHNLKSDRMIVGKHLTRIFSIQKKSHRVLLQGILKS